MKRFFELLKMMLYVLVTIILYLGVNQFVIIVGKSGVETKKSEYLDWFNSLWQVEAKGGGEDWINEKFYEENIDAYLYMKNSPLAGEGRSFISCAKQYDLPKYLMVAIAGAESNFGTTGYATQGTYNAVGLGIHEGRRYTNWGEGICDMAYVLRNFYFDEGRDTTIEIQNKWAPRCVDGNACDNNWAQNVDFFVKELKDLEMS